jgi:hypothetical protein
VLLLEEIDLVVNTAGEISVGVVLLELVVLVAADEQMLCSVSVGVTLREERKLRPAPV